MVHRPNIGKIIQKLLNFIVGKYIIDAVHNRFRVYGDETRLRIAPTAVVNNAFFNLSSGRIEIEDYVFFGHNVSVLTGTHDYERNELERQTHYPKSGRDIVIKKGA